MTGSIVQINVSDGGLPKFPIPEAMVHRLGIEGDRQAHTLIHGGPEQALLLVCAEVVDRLKDEGFPLFYGALGENITTRGIDHKDFRRGQQFRVGPRLWIEITTLREPCRQLDVYGPGKVQKAIYDKQCAAGDPSSPLWAMGGVYAAVIHPGPIRAGDRITFVGEVA